jgi:protein SCO1/2
MITPCDNPGVLGGMLRIVVVFMVVLVAAMFLLPRGQRGAAPQNATELPQPTPLADVRFVDQTGQEKHLSDLKGDFTLLFFGFTNCPDVCPLTLAMLAQVRADIAGRAPRFTPRVLFVSVDPSRDTPDKIAAYLKGFDPAFVGMTAPDAELEPLLKQLGVAVEKQHDHGGGGNYTVVHNSAIYVLDQNADWIAVSTGPHDPKVFASDYLRIRQRHAGAAATARDGGSAANAGSKLRPPGA